MLFGKRLRGVQKQVKTSVHRPLESKKNKPVPWIPMASPAVTMESPWRLRGTPWRLHGDCGGRHGNPGNRFIFPCSQVVCGLSFLPVLRFREDFAGLHGDSAETSCRLHDDLMGLHGDSVGLHGDSMVTAGTQSVLLPAPSRGGWPISNRPLEKRSLALHRDAFSELSTPGRIPKLGTLERHAPV